jgi:multidrug transporter EmrE-like cation transporter
MNIISFLLILSGVILNAGAQLLLKAGTNSLGTLNFNREAILSTLLRITFEPFIIVGLAFYILSFVIWIAALSKVDVSIAYPMLSIGYLINAVAAWYLFGEVVSQQKIAGLVTIMLGVYLVARS